MKFTRETQVLTLLFFIILMLTFARSFLLIESFMWSLEYSVYQEELEKVKRENLLLQERVNQLQSLTRVESEARKRGFVDATYYYFP